MVGITFHTIWGKCRNFLRHAYMHAAKGDLRGWWSRVWSQLLMSGDEVADMGVENIDTSLRFAILHTPDNAVIAQRMAARLRIHGWSAQTFVRNLPVAEHDWYFVLDQAATPPQAGKRWFYLTGSCDITVVKQRVLSKSAAVLAATYEQIEQLAVLKLRYPQVYYVPVPDVTGTEDFNFMLDRFLVAQQLLPFRLLLSCELPIPARATSVILSMPETINRHRSAKQMLPYGYEWFCGVRRQPGWIGCGLSYHSLAQHALKHGVSRLLVIEDDAVIPDAFENTMRNLHDFLDAHTDEWDVFCGMIAVLDPHTTVQAVCTHKGMTMVWVDRMTSMVCNVYASSALQRLANWVPEQKGGVANTIDRYLGQTGQLRIVVALPFLVGHREDAQSTLWSASNRLYSASIQSAEEMLMHKVQDFERRSTSG